MAQRRLAKELHDINCEPHGFSAGPLADDLFHWQATILGPEGTPYEGGAFFLDLKFTSDYPFKPPEVSFTTKIYHPNLSNAHPVCQDLLYQQWSPALNITKLLLSIISLLVEPFPDDPLLPDIAQLYKEDRDEFDRNALEWTRQFAMQ